MPGDEAISRRTFHRLQTTLIPVRKLNIDLARKMGSVCSFLGSGDASHCMQARGPCFLIFRYQPWVYSPSLAAEHSPRPLARIVYRNPVHQTLKRALAGP
jgi:hypothetical protein